MSKCHTTERYFVIWDSRWLDKVLVMECVLSLSKNCVLIKHKHTICIQSGTTPLRYYIVASHFYSLLPLTVSNCIYCVFIKSLYLWGHRSIRKWPIDLNTGGNMLFYTSRVPWVTWYWLGQKCMYASSVSLPFPCVARLRREWVFSSLWLNGDVRINSQTCFV